MSFCSASTFRRAFFQPLVLLALFAPLAPFAPIGCESSEPADSVRIDLTAPQRCSVLGEERSQSEPEASFSQRAGETLDIHLRLPSHSKLQLTISPESAAETVSIRVASDFAQRELDLLSGDGGALRAELADFDGQIVRLRFHNRGPAEVQWIAPELIGIDPLAAAPLPAPDASRVPNIVLYLIDTLRADRLSTYGYSRPTAPHLDRRTQTGIVFEHAYAPGPSTLTTLPALFSSRHSSVLPAQLLGRDGAHWTMPELMHEAGYRTGGFQTNPWVSERLGFARGFDHYEVLIGKTRPKQPAGKAKSWHRPDAEVVHKQALAWLDRTGAIDAETSAAKPFFLFVQTMDVHAPYDPPGPFRDRFGLDVQPGAPRAPRPLVSEASRLMAGPFGIVQGNRESHNPGRYDGSIAYADHALDSFLEALRERGVLRDTVVFVTADHGEALGNFDDGTYLHGHSLYQELVHVPLVVLAPWLERGEQGQRPTRAVSLLDIAPTLFELAGIPVPEDASGRSLLRGSRATCARVVQGERVGSLSGGPKAGAGPRKVNQWYVREGRWKLIGGPDGSGLFDLESDPRELSDLGESRPIARAYLDAIRQATIALGHASPDLATAAPLPPGTQEAVEEALRQLGYIE